jgi:hypothetical protein
MLMSTSKVPKGTDLTRDLINILGVAIALLILAISWAVYSCYKYPLFHTRWYGLPRFLWVLLIVVGGGLMMGFMSVQYWAHRWPLGLDGKFIDPKASDCQLPITTPYLRALPKRSMGFWAGSASCDESLEPQLADVKYDRLAGSNLVWLKMECLRDLSKAVKQYGKGLQVPAKKRSLMIVDNPDLITFRESEFLVNRGWTEYASLHPGGSERVIFNKILDSEDDLRTVSEAQWPSHAELIGVWCGEKKQYLTAIPRKARGMLEKVPAWGTDPAKKPVNIVLILIDSMSRAQAHFAIPKTLEAFSSASGSGKGRTSFEFFRYHTVGHATTQNMPRILRGKAACDKPGDILKNDFGPTQCSLDFETYPYIDRRAKKAGYRTVFVSEECDDVTSMEGPVHIPRISAEPDMDHETINYSCDMQYDGGPRTTFSGAFCLRKRCINNRNVLNYALDYVEKMLEAYEDTEFPSFSYVHLLDNHEGTGEVIIGLDPFFANRVETIMERFGKDTIVLLMSDHGNHMGPHYEFFRSGKIEHKLPLLMISVPDSYLGKYPGMQETIEHNTQKLITADDVHATLVDIIHRSSAGSPVTSTYSALSLFGQKIHDRSCEELTINSGKCLCLPKTGQE